MKAKNKIQSMKNLLKQQAFFFMFLFFLFYLILIPHVSYAEDFVNSFFRLTHSNIEVVDNKVDVEFFFLNSDTRELEQILKDGAKVEMTIDTLLSKDGLIYDANIQEFENIYVLQFDVLTREFVLAKNSESLQRFVSIDDLLYSIFYPLSYLFTPEELEEKEVYKVEIDLRLRHTTIPPWIEMVLFFWNWDIAHADYTFTFAIPKRWGPGI